jgi:hypothetical protein
MLEETQNPAAVDVVEGMIGTLESKDLISDFISAQEFACFGVPVERDDQPRRLD